MKWEHLISIVETLHVCCFRVSINYADKRCPYTTLITKCIAIIDYVNTSEYRTANKPSSSMCSASQTQTFSIHFEYKGYTVGSGHYLLVNGTEIGYTPETHANILIYVRYDLFYREWWLFIGQGQIYWGHTNLLPNPPQNPVHWNVHPLPLPCNKALWNLTRFVH